MQPVGVTARLVRPVGVPADLATLQCHRDEVGIGDDLFCPALLARLVGPVTDPTASTAGKQVEDRVMLVGMGGVPSWQGDADGHLTIKGLCGIDRRGRVIDLPSALQARDLRHGGDGDAPGVMDLRVMDLRVMDLSEDFRNGCRDVTGRGIGSGRCGVGCHGRQCQGSAGQCSHHDSGESSHRCFPSSAILSAVCRHCSDQRVTGCEGCHTDFRASRGHPPFRRRPCPGAISQETMTGGGNHVVSAPG